MGWLYYCSLCDGTAWVAEVAKLIARLVSRLVSELVSTYLDLDFSTRRSAPHSYLRGTYVSHKLYTVTAPDTAARQDRNESR